MGSNIPRRHHYIPKMLLKHFCDDNGKLWMFNKTENIVYPSSQRKAFVEKNQYAHSRMDVSGNVTSTYEYENALGALESEADPIVRMIIGSARCGEQLDLSPNDSAIVKRFLLALARRTRESQARMSAEKDADVIYYNAAKLIAENQGFAPLPEMPLFYQIELISRLRNMSISNVDARFAAGEHPQEQERTELFSREIDLCVMAIQSQNRSFIIGSHGFTIFPTIGEKRRVLGNIFPIAHNVAISLVKKQGKNFLFILDRRNDRYIKAVNMSTLRDSGIVASRSETLIRSLSTKLA